MFRVCNGVYVHLILRVLLLTRVHVSPCTPTGGIHFRSHLRGRLCISSQPAGESQPPGEAATRSMLASLITERLEPPNPTSLTVPTPPPGLGARALEAGVALSSVLARWGGAAR